MKNNDLDLKKWRDYDDILTDSLWVVGERDRSGAHSNTYHGNFIPQIPYQLMRRFTCEGDVVLDAFLGHGTTLIEAKRLGRHGIGVELVAEVAEVAVRNIEREELGGEEVVSEVVVGDSGGVVAREKVVGVLGEMGRSELQLIVLHPPYHDIIKFSGDAACLGNAVSVDDFVGGFGDVVENFVGLLERGRCLAVVVGDKYTDSEWVPLGFRLMDETLRRGAGLRLKSIVVKNMMNSRGKRNQVNLWRYRALAGGFYVFKHEYILVFIKG